jgi:hypothetical protein
MKAIGANREETLRLLEADWTENDEAWRNDIYFVKVRRGSGVAHIIIQFNV